MRAPRSPVVRIKGLGRAAGSAGTRTLAKGTMAVEMTLLEKRVTATTVAEMAAVMERTVAGRAGRHPRLALLVPGLRGRRPGGRPALGLGAEGPSQEPLLLEGRAHCQGRAELCLG